MSVWFVFPSDFRRHRRRFSMSTSIFDGCALIIGLMWQFIPNESIYNVEENPAPATMTEQNERTNEAPATNAFYLWLLTRKWPFLNESNSGQKFKLKWINWRRRRRRRIKKQRCCGQARTPRRVQKKCRVNCWTVKSLLFIFIFALFSFFLFFSFLFRLCCWCHSLSLFAYGMSNRFGYMGWRITPR